MTEMTREQLLAEVKPGDRVKMGSVYKILKLETCQRVTATQLITVSDTGREQKWDRKSGRRIPSLLNGDHVERKATAAEIEQYDSARLKAREEAAEQKARTDEIEAERVRLDDLFFDTEMAPVCVYTSDNHREHGKGWKVTFYGLTAEQVKELAEMTRGLHGNGNGR